LALSRDLPGRVASNQHLAQQERLVTNGRTGDDHLPAIHEPAVYRIRVAGRLDPKWADRVGGMEIVVRDGGVHRTVTELTGTVADQAALQGLLDLLYAHGCVLLGMDLLRSGS
jgi:hypothetical protein